MGIISETMINFILAYIHSMYIRVFASLSISVSIIVLVSVLISVCLCLVFRCVIDDIVQISFLKYIYILV